MSTVGHIFIYKVTLESVQLYLTHTLSCYFLYYISAIQ